MPNKIPVDLAVYVALKEERDILVSHWKLSHQEAGVWRGHSHGRDVCVVCPSRMGRVAAANATTKFLRDYEPDLMVVAGIAGGFSPDVQLGDILIPGQIVDVSLRKVMEIEGEHHHEIRPNVFHPDKRLHEFFESGCFDLSSWQLQVTRDVDWPAHLRPVVHYADVASSDDVVSSDMWRDHLLKAWPKLCGLEMEAGGVCEAARDRTGPEKQVCVIRGVSDHADPSKADDEWRRRSMETVRHILEIFIDSNPFRRTSARTEIRDVDASSERALKRNPDFVGRGRLRQEVRNFVRRSTSGYLTIVGNMGVGKSSFMTELICDHQEEPGQPIFHMIEYHPHHTGEHENIAKSLYQQLMKKYEFVESSEWKTDPPKKRLSKLLAFMSRHILKEGQKEVIYIDAADQAEPSSQEALMPGTLRKLPAGILCVITSRPNIDWKGDFTEVLKMDDFTNDREDIGEFLRKSGELEDDFIGEILQREEPPIFFSVERNIRKLRDSSYPEKEGMNLRTDAKLWTVPPEDLVQSETAHLLKSAEGQGLSPDDVWEALGLLVSAKENLDKNQLDSLGIWRNANLGQVLQLAANFFNHRDPKEPYQFAHPGYHRKVLEELTDPQSTRCHRRLGEACRSWQQLKGKSREYALHFRLEHLRAGERWLEHDKVLCEPNFVQASFEADFVDVVIEAIHDAHDRRTLLDPVVKNFLEVFSKLEIQNLNNRRKGLGQKLRHELGPYEEWPEPLRRRIEDADSYPVMRFLGETRDREGDHHEAVEIFRKLVSIEKVNPTSVRYCDACIKLASVLDHTGQREEGLAVLDEMLDVPDAREVFDQDYWWAQYHKGIFLRQLSKYPESTEILARIRSAREPKKKHRIGAQHHLGIIDVELGWIAKKEGRFEEAKKRFREAEEKFKMCLREREAGGENHRRAYEHLRLGQVYSLTDRLEEAKAAFAESIDVSRKCAHLRYIKKTNAYKVEGFLVSRYQRFPRAVISLQDCVNQLDIEMDELNTALRTLAEENRFTWHEVFAVESATPTGMIAHEDTVHELGLLHATVIVLIVDDQGWIALQERRETESRGKWDASVTGHQDIGETDLEAAVRETKEELGLDVEPELLSRLAKPYEFFKEGSPRVAGDLHINRFHYLYRTAKCNRELVSVFLHRTSRKKKTAIGKGRRESVQRVIWLPLARAVERVRAEPELHASAIKHLLSNEENVEDLLAEILTLDLGTSDDFTPSQGSRQDKGRLDR